MIKRLTQYCLLLSGLFTAYIGAFDKSRSLKKQDFSTNAQAEMVLNESFLRKGAVKPLITSIGQAMVSHQAVESLSINPEGISGKLLQEILQMILQYMFESAYLKKNALQPLPFPYTQIATKSSSNVLSEFLAKIIVNNLTKDRQNLDELKKVLIFISGWAIKEQLNKTTVPLTKVINHYIQNTSKKRMLKHAYYLFAFFELCNITKTMLTSSKITMTEKFVDGLQKSMTFVVWQLMKNTIEKITSPKQSDACNHDLIPQVPTQHAALMSAPQAKHDRNNSLRIEAISKLIKFFEQNKKSGQMTENLEKINQAILQLNQQAPTGQMDTPDDQSLETPGEKLTQDAVFNNMYMLVIRQPESIEHIISIIESITAELTPQ